MFAERHVSLFLTQEKNDVNQKVVYLGKNDVTKEQAKSTGMTPNKKVNKAGELTYLFTSIEQTSILTNFLF
jgi:hypothetical protein